MPHCVECGKKVDEDDDFCPECGAKTKHKTKEKGGKEEPEEEERPSEKTKVVERVVEREVPVIKEVRHSGGGGLVVVIIILLILGILFFVFAQSGALDEMFKGSGVSYVDPCEREFQQCNHECGEGWGSGLCKSACTNQYHKCKD